MALPGSARQKWGESSRSKKSMPSGSAATAEAISSQTLKNARRTDFRPGSYWKSRSSLFTRQCPQYLRYARSHRPVLTDGACCSAVTRRALCWPIWCPVAICIWELRPGRFADWCGCSADEERYLHNRRFSNARFGLPGVPGRIREHLSDRLCRRDLVPLSQTGLHRPQSDGECSTRIPIHLQGPRRSHLEDISRSARFTAGAPVAPIPTSSVSRCAAMVSSVCWNRTGTGSV